MKPHDGQSKDSKPESDAKGDLKSLPLPEVEKKLESSPDGLAVAEAEKRLAQYGPNEIVEKKENQFLKLLTYFWGPIPWMIEAAVILSAVVQHWPDFFIILLLLCSNAAVGFWEEHQAGNAIAVYGVFMTPLGWGWAFFIWGYALAWFFVNDRVKLLAYHIFDPLPAAAATA